MRIALVVLLALFLVSPAVAQEDAMVTKEMVLDAIAELESNPQGNEAEENIITIITYAGEDPDVDVMYSSLAVPEKIMDAQAGSELILLGAYTAGSTKAQLKGGGDGVLAGAEQMIKTYRQLKAQNAVQSIEEIDNLITLQDQGKLADYLDGKSLEKRVDPVFNDLLQLIESGNISLYNDSLDIMRVVGSPTRMEDYEGAETTNIKRRWTYEDKSTDAQGIIYLYFDQKGQLIKWQVSSGEDEAPKGKTQLI